MADGDGKVELEIELKSDGIDSQARKLGKQAGESVAAGITGGTGKAGNALKSLKGTFGSAFAAIGGIVGTFSMGAVINQIMSVGQAFESSMSKVQALSGASAEEFDKLSSKLTRLGGQLVELFGA